MATEPTGTPAVFQNVYGRELAFGIHGFLAAVGAGLAGLAIVEGVAAIVVFFAIYLGFVAFSAYFSLLRTAVELTIAEDDSLMWLFWTAPLRSGRIPLSAIVKIRPQGRGSNVIRIEQLEGRSVWVLVQPGLQDFFDELCRFRPDLEVQVGLLSRLFLRMGPFRTWRRISTPTPR